MNEALNELGGHIEAKRPDCVLGWAVAFDELTVDVAPSNLLGLVELLKADHTCRFSTLVDITAVDFPERRPRFDVVYNLLSHKQNQRIRIKVGIDEDKPVPSACEVYSAANWAEPS